MLAGVLSASQGEPNEQGGNFWTSEEGQGLLRSNIREVIQSMRPMLVQAVKDVLLSDNQERSSPSMDLSIKIGKFAYFLGIWSRCNPSKARLTSEKFLATILGGIKSSPSVAMSIKAQINDNADQHIWDAQQMLKCHSELNTMIRAKMNDGRDRRLEVASTLYEELIATSADDHSSWETFLVALEEQLRFFSENKFAPADSGKFRQWFQETVVNLEDEDAKQNYIKLLKQKAERKRSKRARTGNSREYVEVEDHEENEIGDLAIE